MIKIHHRTEGEVKCTNTQKNHIMKYTTFFVPILLLFLSASLFASCESETIEEESKLYELKKSEQRAIDKGDLGTFDDRDPSDDDDNNDL